MRHITHRLQNHLKMYHFTLTGSIDKLTNKEASDKIGEISPQWENENTKFGKLYMGVYDWAYSNDKGNFQLHIPKLRAGGEIQKNTAATSFFGFDIFGDCFLEENNDGANKMMEL